METHGVLAYNFPDDDTSDESSSSSSSSGSSTVSKKLAVPKYSIKADTIASHEHLASVIGRLHKNLHLTRRNSQGDEFSSRSRSSSDSKESEIDIEEREELSPTEDIKINYIKKTNLDCIEDENVNYVTQTNLNCIKDENVNYIAEKKLNFIENEHVESDNDNTVLQFFQLGPAATSEDIATWLKDNSFGKFIDLFEEFSYYDIRRLDRNDFIEMCGTVKGIQLYNAVQMKPVRPLRVVYCAREPPNTSGINWQPVYLHSLNALDFNAEIVARFNLSTRKHSLWMEGPYGIHILVDNEVVEYMEDNDMFLIRLVEYPSVEHYKIILKKYL